MDNGAILNTDGNEFNTFENLRTSNENNIRQQAVNPRIRPGNEAPGSQIEDDQVELSRESINLAGIEENTDLAAAVEPPSIIAETEPPPETEPIPAETAVPLEEQATRLARINNALNTAYGLTVGVVNPEAETPGEVARNEQQILLQQVGSQLAQVIPPASVFSVVG